MIIAVIECVTDGQAALPEDGESLALKCYDRMRTETVELDFKGVRGMNSAFSNAFFLSLVDHGISERQLRHQLKVIGLSSFQKSVFERSREAVIKRAQEESWR
jgi:hypothetical protein